MRKRTLLSKLARRLLAIPHRRSYRREQARLKKAEEKTRFLEAGVVVDDILNFLLQEIVTCATGGPEAD